MKPEDIEDLKQLVEFLKENQVAEFDLDRGDLKIRLKFAQPAAPIAGITHVLAGAPGVTVQPVAGAIPAPGAAASVAAGPASAEVDSGLHYIKSPIVGTFYGSPSPGAPSFVSPGDHVDKGQVVCIIEAMKLMNEIESDTAGEIVKCMVSNGQPIEFGQPLFAVKTA
ncbi:MAG TPA: acetyl-CoA carboxylase biotin carboxyl carrier protein [Terracidiphilus sp.]|jgi:acetyl-CoA carboxylase biotin carboxyl carrier protein|nr:acetyl-CoA carboxylase biotin carboxyl carrier protein [Terracidiphilus sp.]